MAASNEAQARLAAKVAINERISRMSPADRVAMTEAARAARRRQIEDEIDPKRELDPADLDARVKARIRAHMARAALRAAAVRRARREAAEAAALADLVEQAAS